MDAVSYSHSAKQAQRIEKFIKNPDSKSGIVTVPKVIGAGENITIPAGRVAVLPNVQVDGTLNIEGEVFIPSGATFGDLEKGLLPIGTILNGYTIFANCIVAFGGVFNRADYPKLWAYLQANPTLVKTQAQWTTENTTNGMCGFFSDGNGTTTFRVPNLDKAFLRPDSRTVGSYQNDAFQGHYHNAMSISQAVFVYGTNQGGYTDNGFNSSTVREPVSDGANGTPRISNETRPKNIAVLPLIVAK